ncbi:hypothetical protein, partial [Pseudomonas syringae]|uniref:hypothetical protein n=1 Tax=Pseudomonas syringae TaxID=317 RepID=UPI001F3B3507
RHLFAGMGVHSQGLCRSTHRFRSHKKRHTSSAKASIHFSQKNRISAIEGVRIQGNNVRSLTFLVRKSLIRAKAAQDDFSCNR